MKISDVVYPHPLYSKGSLVELSARLPLHGSKTFLSKVMLTLV